MMRSLAIAITCLTAAACGNGGGDDGTTPIDTAVVDTQTVDMAPPIDEPPPCTKPVIFINGDGGIYHAGVPNSINNTTPLLTSNLNATGPGALRTNMIAMAVRTALAAENVQVTITDPGTAIHVEVVLIDSNWTFGNPVAVSSQNCNVMPVGVGFVNATGGNDDAIAGVLFVIGANAGLDLSTAANNCMNTAVAGCTFSATATVAGNCGGATQDQPASIHTAFGCN